MTVGLLWHSVSSHNFGIGALTLANIRIIRRVAAARGLDVSFIVIGWRDDRAPYVDAPDVTMLPVRTRAPGKLISAIRSCDIVFDIGAGDSFSDLYGVKRFLYLAGSKLLVQAFGVPLIISPQTIGPYRRKWVRNLAAQILKRASAVVVRDRLSWDYVRGMGVERNCVEAADVAFELPADKPLLEPSEKIRVGINASGLLFNGGAEMARRLGLSIDYPALMERVTERFAGMEKCEVHLIGHVFPDDPVEDDRRAMARLAEGHPEIVVAPDFSSPTEAKAYIGSMDFFIGARMHACIAAFSSGVPVVPMAYSRKFSGLFGSLGYDHVVDCTGEDYAAALGKIMRGFAARDRLREQVLAGRETARAKLRIYETVIGEGLEAAGQRRPSRGMFRRRHDRRRTPVTGR